MAGVLAGLMSRLGYGRYGVQGYDTGSWVAPETGKQALSGPVRSQPRTQVVPVGHRDVTALVTGSRRSVREVDSGALKRTP